MAAASGAAVARRTLALINKRSAAQQRSDERTDVHVTRVHTESELVPVAKIASLVDVNCCACAVLTQQHECFPALGHTFYLLGRGDSIIDLEPAEASFERRDDEIAYRLRFHEQVAMRREKLIGARVYVAYAELADDAARQAADACAATLPRSWRQTMVAHVC